MARAPRVQQGKAARGSRLPMDVAQLRRVLNDLPDDTPVVIEDSRSGWMQNVGLYLAPAHVERCVTGNFLHAQHHRDTENCHALLMSAFYQADRDLIELTPHTSWPEVIDCDSDAQQRQFSLGAAAFDDAAPPRSDPVAQGGLDQ